MQLHYVTNWTRVNPDISAYNSAADFINQTLSRQEDESPKRSFIYPPGFFNGVNLPGAQEPTESPKDYDPADISGAGSPQDYVPPDYGSEDTTPPPADYLEPAPDSTPQFPPRFHYTPPNVQAVPDVQVMPNPIPDVSNTPNIRIPIPDQGINLRGFGGGGGIGFADSGLSGIIDISSEGGLQGGGFSQGRPVFVAAH